MTIDMPAIPPAFWGRDGDGDGFRAATVCRRGHEHSIDETGYPGDDLGRCGECGADVLSACPHCGRRLRGAGVGGTLRPYAGRKPPSYRDHAHRFCDGCGGRHPWADERCDLVNELLNLLDEQDISEFDRRQVTEDLRRIGALDPVKDGKELNRLRDAIVKRAPGMIAGATALIKLVETVRHLN